MNSITIKPFKNKSNDLLNINIPSSKSLSIRALILASISSGKSKIKNVLKSDDTNDCIAALKSLGIKIKVNNNKVEIEGCEGIFPLKQHNIVFFGSSGITSRFLLAILCASLSKDNRPVTHKIDEILLDGSDQLRKRSIKPLVDTLKNMGANITYQDKEGFFPLVIRAAKLNNIDKIEVSGALSSQYVSAILMAAPLLNKKSIIEVKDIESSEHPYIKMALETIRDFGINNIKDTFNKKNTYEFFPNPYKATNFTIETDLNTANYFFALAAILNKKIKIKNINKNSLQPGLKFFNILQKLGCDIEFIGDDVILKGTNKLKGGFTIDMFYIAELSILLAVLAVFADSPIEIRGVKHIRNHESDRIFAICNELKKAGIIVEEFDDGLKVTPGTPKFIEANSYDDHRIAMSLAILGASYSGITILNSNCVSKTCPEFFDMLFDLESR